MINADDVAVMLIQVSIGTVLISRAEDWHWINRTYRTTNGWKFEVFNDAGGMDYIDRVEAPDGRKAGFDDWEINPLDLISGSELRGLAKHLHWEEE